MEEASSTRRACNTTSDMSDVCIDPTIEDFGELCDICEEYGYQTTLDEEEMKNNMFLTGKFRFMMNKMLFGK